MKTQMTKDTTRMLAADLLAGFAIGFVGAVLSQRRRAPVKPPTAARMRPIDVPVRVGEVSGVEGDPREVPAGHH